MIEHWKDIPDYKGFYQASNQGRIRSMDRQVQGKLGSIRNIKGKVLSGTDDGKGYLKVALQTSGRKTRKLMKVHRLVAMTFINNDDPSEKIEINHINGIKHDNRVANLEWSSPSDNTRHSIYILNKDMSKGSRRRRVARIDINGKIISEYDSIREAARLNGFNEKTSSIYEVASGKRKQYKGTYWKYL